MNINATLLIQAFNFYIVYWLLRIFLFKPAIKAIEEEKARKMGMLDSIDQQKKSIEVQERERQRHWYTCQEYFTIHQARFVKTIFLPMTEQDAPVIDTSLSESMVESIARDVHDSIKETIKHVH